VDKNLIDPPEKKLQGKKAVSFPTDKKSLLNMVIFLVVAFGVIAFLFYQNYQLEASLMMAPAAISGIKKPPISPGKMTNWRKYENEVFGFAFEYPSNWQKPELNQLTTRTKVTIRDGKELGNLIARLEVSRGFYYSQSLQRELTLNEYIDEQIFPKEAFTSESVRLDNWQGRRVTHHVHGLGYYVTYLFLVDPEDETHLLEFIYRHTDEEYKSEMPKTLEQILASFRFFDSQSEKCLPVTQPCNPKSCDYDPTKCGE